MSRSESAYQSLKREIVTCRIRPGETVTEMDLSSRLDVGKTPVREALRRLMSEGLIAGASRRGYVIAPVTLSSVRDAFGLRLILETEGARLAATRILPEDLAELDRLARTQWDVDKGASQEAFVQANSAFHRLVSRSSGNERLYLAVSQLDEEMVRLFHLGLELRDPQPLEAIGHIQVVEALAAQDAESAARIMADHIEQSRDLVVQGLMSTPSLQSVNLGS